MELIFRFIIKLIETFSPEEGIVQNIKTCILPLTGNSQFWSRQVTRFS